ncbi:MAG TPA: hypothetical protein VF029_04775 [Actinomycetota bacterium]
MTDRAPRRRASKRELRVWAWIAGGLALFAPWAGLGASPKPAATASAGPDERPVIVIRKITRRIVIRERPAQAPVTYVYTEGSSSGSSGGSSGGGSVNAAPPPPATNTGGS